MKKALIIPKNLRKLRGLEAIFNEELTLERLMHTLLLETGLEKGIAILAKDQSILWSKPLVKLQVWGHQLLEEIEKGANAHGFSLSEVERIGVGVGPGSYTGIRVGVSIAETLSFAQSIPLVPICSLDLMVPKQEGPFVVLVDARSGGIYARFGQKSAKTITYEGPAKLIQAIDLKDFEGQLLSCDPEQLQKRADWAYSRPLDAEIDVDRFLELTLQREGVIGQCPDILYLR